MCGYLIFIYLFIFHCKAQALPTKGCYSESSSVSFVIQISKYFIFFCSSQVHKIKRSLETYLVSAVDKPGVDYVFFSAESITAANKNYYSRLQRTLVIIRPSEAHK